jgi:tetratricopeptide (TPR) repeat protein
LATVATSCVPAGPADLTTSAGDARAHGNYRECIRLATQQLDTVPENVRALQTRGECYLAERNGLGAYYDDSQAIKLSPRDPVLYVERASASDLMGNAVAARADYQLAAQLSSQHVVEAAERLATLGFPMEALNVVDRGLRVAPNNWDLHRYRAELEDQLGDWAIALSEWDIAFAMAPARGSASVRGSRARGELRHGLYKHAAESYSQAISLDAFNYEFFEGRAVAEFAMLEPDAAQADLTEALNVYAASGADDWHRVRLYEERAEVYLAQGLRASAVADLEVALRYVPAGGDDWRRLQAAIAAAPA